MFQPNKQEFIKLAKKGNLIPVYKEIMADMETPVSAYKKIAVPAGRQEGKYSFLLESVEGGENIARYSFLGSVTKEQLYQPESLEEVRELLSKFKPVNVKGLPRFHGGLVGYAGYDIVRQIENIPNNNKDDLKLPQLLFLLTDTILAFDHVKHKILIISNAEIKGNPQKAYNLACKKIDELEKKLKKPLSLDKVKLEVSVEPKKKIKFKSNMTQKEFENRVKKAKEYIRAGDIIQTVISQRLETEVKVDPFNVYRVLRTVNPSPYMFYFNFGGIKIAGSSPEVMVRLEGKQATVRPIAGTRPRGKDEVEDKKLAENLLASKKERAEHIMLLDLGRNDLGRVCEYGSVKVTEEMVVEKYSHVMHLVSNVTGKIKRNQDAIDLLKATFPAGTVSGAPKVRAMEIIDELENVQRGLYAGCIGYFGFYGELDSCIAIRTILFRNNKVFVQAGAGIVQDSNPTKEYQETLNKAKAMLRAIELAS